MVEVVTCMEGRQAGAKLELVQLSACTTQCTLSETGSRVTATYQTTSLHRTFAQPHGKGAIMCLRFGVLGVWELSHDLNLVGFASVEPEGGGPGSSPRYITIYRSWRKSRPKIFQS
jgi:hypothetical protein